MRVFVLALLALIAACAKMPVYTAPVIPWDLKTDSVAGRTVCSLNNLPLSLVDYGTWDSVNREFILAHEQVHANDMYRFKGGCWPFLYKYNSDKNFAFLSEYKAYCAEGRLAIQRNAIPETVWLRMQNALAKIDTARAMKMPNCLY